jgi:hypothetical protein
MKSPTDNGTGLLVAGCRTSKVCSYGHGQRQLHTRGQQKASRRKHRVRLCWESEDGRSEAVATASLGWAPRTDVIALVLSPPPSGVASAPIVSLKCSGFLLSSSNTSSFSSLRTSATGSRLGAAELHQVVSDAVGYTLAAPKPRSRCISHCPFMQLDRLLYLT